MAKTKNGPSSMRMGFGAKAAIQAGVPVIKPRSTEKLNYENFLLKHPDARGRGAELLAKKLSYTDALHSLREEGYEGNFYVEFWSKNNLENENDIHADDNVICIYSDDLDYIRNEAKSRIALGAVAEARFMRRCEGTEGSAADENWEPFNPDGGAPGTVP